MNPENSNNSAIVNNQQLNNQVVSNTSNAQGLLTNQNGSINPGDQNQQIYANLLQS